MWRPELLSVFPTTAGCRGLPSCEGQQILSETQVLSTSLRNVTTHYVIRKVKCGYEELEFDKTHHLEVYINC